MKLLRSILTEILSLSYKASRGINLLNRKKKHRKEYDRVWAIDFDFDLDLDLDLEEKREREREKSRKKTIV